MSKKARFSIVQALHRARPLPAHQNHDGQRTAGRSAASTAAEEGELTIELLEERLTPGYPVRALKKTAGWGC